MKAKLKFLEFVSNNLYKFLRGYETDQPMVLKLMKVDANDVNLHKPYDLIQIGTAAKFHVVNYKKSNRFLRKYSSKIL